MFPEVGVGLVTRVDCLHLPREWAWSWPGLVMAWSMRCRWLALLLHACSSIWPPSLRAGDVRVELAIAFFALPPRCAASVAMRVHPCGWRRLCDGPASTSVGVHARLGADVASNSVSTSCVASSGLSAMRLTPWIHSGPSCSSLLHAGDGSHLVSGVPGGMSSICFGWHLMLITAMDVGPNLWVQIVTSPPWHAHSSPSNS